MRLRQSLLLLALAFSMGIFVSIAFVLTLSTGFFLVVALMMFVGWRWLKTTWGSWFTSMSPDAVLVNPDGTGHWTLANEIRLFQVGSRTLLTPWVIILHCQSPATSEQHFFWISKDSLNHDSYRDLLLKLKHIRSQG